MPVDQSEVVQKRLLDAYCAVSGACNPGALIRSMAYHMDADPQLRFGALLADPGMRMLTFQLATLMFGDAATMNLNSSFTQDYDACAKAWEARDQEKAR